MILENLSELKKPDIGVIIFKSADKGRVSSGIPGQKNRKIGISSVKK